MRKFLSNWLPVVIWLAFIALESTDMMSGEHTGNFLHSILTPWFGEIPYRQLDLLNFLLRKTGHLTGYAVLSLLVFRGLIRTFTGSVTRWAGLAIAFTALVASADEYHQSFIPSRTSSIRDVMLDVCGAVLMMLFTLLTLKLQSRRRLA
jgi:VanZ family protein